MDATLPFYRSSAPLGQINPVMGCPPRHRGVGLRSVTVLSWVSFAAGDVVHGRVQDLTDLEVAEAVLDELANELDHLLQVVDAVGHVDYVAAAKVTALNLRLQRSVGR